MTDNVNHPPHYTVGGYEAIDVIASKLGEEGYILYALGNAMKYLLRCRYKGKMLEDLKKAAWYINSAVEKLDGENKENQDV